MLTKLQTDYPIPIGNMLKMAPKTVGHLSPERLRAGAQRGPRGAHATTALEFPTTFGLPPPRAGNQPELKLNLRLKLKLKLKSKLKAQSKPKSKLAGFWREH